MPALWNDSWQKALRWPLLLPTETTDQRIWALLSHSDGQTSERPDKVAVTKKPRSEAHLRADKEPCILQESRLLGFGWVRCLSSKHSKIRIRFRHLLLWFKIHKNENIRRWCECSIRWPYWDSKTRLVKILLREHFNAIFLYRKPIKAKDFGLNKNKSLLKWPYNWN